MTYHAYEIDHDIDHDIDHNIDHDIVSVNCSLDRLSICLSVQPFIYLTKYSTYGR